MLEQYAARLPCVEVNATFRRVPSPETTATWSRQVPAGFVFALKAPQRITHFARLRGAESTLGALLRAAAELGPALGPILFQLPPTFSRDLPLLRDFLGGLPRGLQAAFEFRHGSWLEDPVLGTLADAGVALCTVDAEDHPVPLVPTARFGYLRLRRPSYDDASLRRWSARILSQPWSESLVFFKHEEEALGPALALRLGTVLAEVEGASTGAPPA